MTQPEKERQIYLIDYLIVLLKHKRLILLGCLACAILAVNLCFVVSPMYTATTKLMPPDQGASQAASQLLTQVGGVAGIALGGGTTPTGDLYVGILQTDPVLDHVIKRFDLLKLYDVKTWAAARRILSEDMMNALVDSKSSIISVSVDDQDPQRAADMTNALVEKLAGLLNQISDIEAGKKRRFFERELKDIREALIQAESALQGFQERTGALDVSSQAGAILQGIASLKAQVAAQQIQIRVMRTYSTPSNPDLKRAEEQLQGMKEQLSKLEEQETAQTADPFIPTSQMPSVGIEYIRKLREFKFQEALYNLMIQQYEAARLDEARETVSVQVIQPASQPEVVSKPKVLIMGPLAGAVGLFLFTLIALIREMAERASSDPNNEERMRVCRRVLRRF